MPYNEQNLRLRFLPPAWLDGGNLLYLLGTDNLGRDVLSRIIVGAQASFIVAIAALAFGSVMGSLIGLTSGYFGGRFDAFVMRTADGMMSFPLVLAALLLVAVIGPGVHTVVIATSLILWARFARLIRSEVLSVRERDFVKLSRIAGASNIRIMLVHILPNVLNSVVVLLTLQLGFVIIVEATLSFLGAGRAAADPDVGPDGGRRPDLYRDRVVDLAVSGPRDRARGPVVQSAGRLAARSPRPETASALATGLSRRRALVGESHERETACLASRHCTRRHGLRAWPRPPDALTQTPGVSSDTSLASCPARRPVLRIAGVFPEEFSPHPVETRFSSTTYTWLHQVPLFGVDPWEENVDPAYGVAESWEFLPGLQRDQDQGPAGPDIQQRRAHYREGRGFFDQALHDQVRRRPGRRRAQRASASTIEVVDDHNLRIDFAKGAVTFPQEFSPLVFPLYVTSEAYHSNGDISQAAVEKFRANPLSAGPYKVVARQAQQFITLEAARKDPLLGCPVYERIEIRNIQETGTRIAQFRTGALDIVAGNRDLIQQVKSIGAQIVEKPANNMIGLYIFQTNLENNVFQGRAAAQGGGLRHRSQADRRDDLEGHRRDARGAAPGRRPPKSR